MKKRIASILLAVMMIVTLLPLGLVDTAYAAETANSGTCGDNVTWRLSDDGTLTISGTGDMADFEWDGTPWCSVSSQVKSVVIKDGVTSIGDCAFGGCISLTSVSIPDGVISIGFAAFESCSLLTGVTIPNSVTGIGDYAFGYCSSLISVTIPGSVTSIGEAAFAGGSTSVNVSRENKNYCSVDGGLYDKQKTTIFHPGKIQNGAFRVPDGVNRIGDSAFFDCTSLTSVIIPKSVTSIGSLAFLGCIRLTNVTIPDGVTSIGDAAFAGSSTSINVSRENKNYCSVDGGLYNKQKTTILHPGKIQNGTFRVPDGVTSIGDYAFDGYRSLTNVTIPDSVTNICYGAFLDCIKLTDVYYDGTASDWAKITIEEGNEDLTNATLHCAKSAPAAPVVKLGNSATSGKPMLTWNAVYGATSYRIYRSTSRGSGYSLLGTVTATSYTNTGAKAGTTYYYRVKACNDAGLSPYSNIVSGKVKSVTPKPSAPVVKIGNSASSGKPMLTWNAVSGATSYKVYRATSQNGTYSLLGTVTATSYTNTGAKAGVTYYYKVKAVNSAGESAYSNTVSGRATVTTLTMGHSSTSGKPQLTWKAVSGAASYKVYRSTSKNGAYSVINTTKALTYTNTGAALGTTYYYKVEALNAAGKSMGFSDVVEGKVAPVLAVGYSSVSGKPQLTWKAVPGATEYQVYRSTQQNSGYTKINTTTATSYVNTGAKANTTYYYKIVAVKGTAVSDFSNIVSARPSK
jgi:fibronectin type 3 domain-containing protein